MNINFFEILLISISLAMDAFSVSISKGITMNYKIKRNSLILATSFSIFQMIMPLIGYYLGNLLNIYLLKYNYLIVFFILTIIGINMIKESYSNNIINSKLSLKELLLLSIATSIDALSIGITFSLFKINLLLTISIIGIITFILSFIGVNLGKILNNKFNNINILGGIILIILGLKNLLELF